MQRKQVCKGQAEISPAFIVCGGLSCRKHNNSGPGASPV